MLPPCDGTDLTVRADFAYVIQAKENAPEAARRPGYDRRPSARRAKSGLPRDIGLLTDKRRDARRPLDLRIRHLHR
jgi:hypothetical protein